MTNEYERGDTTIAQAEQWSLAHWLRHDMWTGEQAVLILADVDPHGTRLMLIPYGGGVELPSPGSFAHALTWPDAPREWSRDRLQRAWSHWDASGRPAQKTPAEWIVWADERGVWPDWLAWARAHGLPRGGAERPLAGWEGFDETAPNYPPELDIALQAWRHMTTNDTGPGRTPKQRLLAYLDRTHPGLTPEARKRIAQVANWNSQGGRPDPDD